MHILLEFGRENVRAADNAGNSVLHAAASGGHVEVVKVLLQQGVDINVKVRHSQ